MEIFTKEIEDGLESQFAKQFDSISYASQLNESKPDLFKLMYKGNVSDFFAKSKKEDFDLYYSHSILVSTGWNLNDDVFLPVNVWAARHTPEDKPFNYEHKELDIIGHIISNIVVDGDNKIIQREEDLPDSFNIVTGFVIYKKWMDKSRSELIEKVLSEIKEGKWFVSMECLFSGFDYALSKEQENHVVARSEESAFLTKHLRAYGGTGQYDGYKVGRILKNITFSGKGLVSRPANPNSVIFNQINPFSGVNNSVANIWQKQEDKKELILNLPVEIDIKTKIVGELIMADADVKVLEDKLADSEKKLNDALAKITSLNEEIGVYKGDIGKANDELKQKDVVVSEVKAQLDKSITANTELEVKVKTLSDEISGIKAEQKKALRTKSLVESGLKDEELESTYNKFVSLDDTVFGEMVALIKRVPKSDVKISDEDKAKAAQKALDDLTAKNEAKLVVTPVPTHEKVAADIADFMKNRNKDK